MRLEIGSWQSCADVRHSVLQVNLGGSAPRGAGLSSYANVPVGNQLGRAKRSLAKDIVTGSSMGFAHKRRATSQRHSQMHNACGGSVVVSPVAGVGGDAFRGVGAAGVALDQRGGRRLLPGQPVL